MLPIALVALHHRGPDDQGTAVARAGDWTIGFAHTRLSILDVSAAGHQPMLGEAGQMLVLNGEIYNHLELRPALEADGVRFIGTSDTETLLYLLIKEGVAALDRLTGMFAFAFWDPASATLIMARDRLGKKPLYWVRHPTGGLVFASEVRALLATGAAPRELDPLGLVRWLERGSSQEPTTLIRGVRSVRPGHVMTVSASGEHERAYWTLDLAPAPLDWRDQLEATLDDAVRLRLLADRPLGVFLSGGVDSSAIAAIAVRHARSSLETFTLTFDEEAWDEGARAKAMADRLGLNHNASHLTASEALSHMDDALAAQDLPSHDGFNTWFVTRAARAHGFVVALAGTGGDELFSGYPHFRRFKILQRFGAATRFLPAALRRSFGNGLHSGFPTRIQKVIELAGSQGRPEAIYAVLREMFSHVAIERLLGHTVAQPEHHSSPPRFAAAYAASARDPETQLSLLELDGYLVDTQLRDIDTMSMAHGLEVRSPLLDDRLIAAVLAVPSSFRVPSKGINKRLLVDLAGLPHAHFRQPKRGFVIPWEQWLRGPLANWTASHLAPGILAETGALDPAVVGEKVQRFNHGRGGVVASRVLSLVALSAWCQRYGIRNPG